MTLITHFADPECHGWDQETGMPTSSFFGGAVQLWSLAQDRPVTVREAALAFNVTPDLMRQAINDHPWMLLGGSEKIEHDGE